MTARLSGTYRAARRNMCLRSDLPCDPWSPAWYFAGGRKAHGHRGVARYVPHEIRRARYKQVTSAAGLPMWVRTARAQPKVYRGTDKSRAERLAIKLAAGNAA